MRVDCSVPVVEAWSKLSADFWANGTVAGNLPDGGTSTVAPSVGDLYLQVDGGIAEDMTWDGTKWSVAPSSCEGVTLTVTSTIGGVTDSASFTVP